MEPQLVAGEIGRPDLRDDKPGRHPVVVSHRKCGLRIGADEGLLIDPPRALECADLVGIETATVIGK
jgi:hypothetical protein